MPFISELEQIFIQRFYTGWITLRNQLTTPIKLVGRRVIELYDALIAGNDWEVTPRLTLKRRAGHTSYVASVGFPTLNMYSFKSNTQGTIPIIDTLQNVSYINSSNAEVSINNKTATTGKNLQSSFLGIGNYLYIGNPQTNFKWDGPSGVQGVTNWGISIGLFGISSGPNTAGTGANAAGSNPWTNPNNVTSAVSYATVTLPLSTNSAFVNATNFGFSISASTIITGISVTFDEFGSTSGVCQLAIVPLKNGNQAATGQVTFFDGSSTTVTFGSSSNLWGTTWTYNDINQTGFGFAFQARNGGIFNNFVAELRNVKITVYGLGAPTATPTGSGSFSAVNGFSYVVAYGNSQSGEISNATPISINTGPFSNKAYVGIPLTASSDPQVNQDRVYRTTDSGGGNQFFEIGNSPFPNIGYTFTSVANASGGSTVYTGSFVGTLSAAVGQNFQVAGFTNAANNGTFPATAATANTLTLTNAGGVAETHAATGTLLAEDTTLDTALQVTSQAEINLGNTPPPVGLVNLEWFAGRMWGSLNNLLFASTGPETLSGTAPNSNWNPAFQFVIPQPIQRNVRWATGMLVFTVDDCYIVRGTDITNYTVNEFVKDFGVRTYNAIDTDGTNLYVFTSDRQFILLAASGAQDIGLPIADQLLNVDPTSVYVKVNRYGLDSIVRILDAVNNVAYDYNLNQQCWNLPVIFKMLACKAMGSIETSPGVWRLLVSTTNSGINTLAYRDINNFLDLTTAYAPNAVFGSIQLADPGMLVKMGARGGFVMQYTNAGTVPTLSVLPNDAGATLTNAVGSQITGNFATLSTGGNPVPWPPTLGQLSGPIGFRNLGYYYAVGRFLSAFLMHLQFQLSAVAENKATELLGWGIFGDYSQEAPTAGAIPQLQGK